MSENKKVAIITGSSRGIGKACALELAKAGYDIAVTYAGSDEAAQGVAAEIKALGVDAKPYKFDVSSKEECDASIAKILEDFGQVDVLVNNAGKANYSAAKAGMIGFTKSLAKELGSRNIRVNAIAPGFIQTDMTNDLDTEKIAQAIPLKKLGQPEDIAKAVKFLAEDAPYITGQVIGVDGGLVV